jgi:hypothetical protein
LKRKARAAGQSDPGANGILGTGGGDLLQPLTGDNRTGSSV